MRHASASTTRAGVQKRRPPNAERGGRTAWSPSGPPITSDRPRTTGSECAGSSTSRGSGCSTAFALMGGILPDRALKLALALLARAPKLALALLARASHPLSGLHGAAPLGRCAPSLHGAVSAA